MKDKNISIKWHGIFIDQAAHAFANGNYARPPRGGREKRRASFYSRRAT